jgi:hypothetical protein
MESRILAERSQRIYLDWNKSSFEEKKDVVAHPEKYWVLGDIRASETDIGELRLQDLKATENYISFKYNILFEAMSQPAAMGILFFDEMNLAPNMIKAQFYKIINDKAIGDIPISDGVLCVSAGNEAEHSRGVTDDPIPLSSRRANHLIRPLTSTEYLDYAVKSGQHQWVSGFLAFNGAMVHNIDYRVSDSSGQPCARTWTKLSNILTNNPDLKLGNKEDQVDEVEMHAIAWVGNGAGQEFAAYVRAARKVNLDDVLKNPQSINEYVSQQDLSMAYAIISGIVDRFRSDKKVLRPAFEVCLAIGNINMGAYLLRSIKNVDETKFTKMSKDEGLNDLAMKVVERYAKFLIRT